MIVAMAQPQAHNPTPPNMQQDDARWQSLIARAPTHDAFLYGVITTGIFCRPTCASRLPLRRNVRFFDTAAEAERAGFRACLRCRPTQQPTADPSARVIEEACRWMAQHAEQPVGTAALADRAGMSAAHFHRVFQRFTGITPKQYADNLRTQHFKAELEQGRSVTSSLYASGFGSSSRMYEKTDRTLGMVPRAYRAGGLGMDLSYATLPTSLGPMLLAASDRGICFLQFGDDTQGYSALRAEFPHATLEAMNEAARPEFERWVQAIQQSVNGSPGTDTLPLDLRATAFQLRVWNYLQTIPSGEPRSYAQAAAELGMPQSTRAVASACARNRVALLVPCHRVLRGDGSLGGYRWGLERKAELLRREAAATRGSQTPAAPSIPSLSRLP